MLIEILLKLIIRRFYMKSLATLIVSLSLAVPLYVVDSSTSHSHADDVSSNSTPIIHSLPVAPEYQPDKATVNIESTTKVNVLNENGETVDTLTTYQTVAQSRNSIQAANRTVTVLAVADEEYRSAYPDWQTRIQTIVENSDDAFIRDQGIDFQVQAVGSWSSQGADSSQILADLSRDWSGRSYDFVVGFTKDANFDAGGIAYVYSSDPAGSAFSVNLDQGITNTAKAAQHEFSHNYGLGHDNQGSGIRCVMNYDYAYTVDYWHADHSSQIQRNKTWYGY